MRSSYSIVIAIIYVLPVLLALLAGWLVYRKYPVSENGKRRSIILLFLGLVLFGFIGTALLNAIAFNFICTENSGALCTFGISFVTIPLSWILSISAFLFVWASSGRRAKNGAH